MKLLTVRPSSAAAALSLILRACGILTDSKVSVSMVILRWCMSVIRSNTERVNTLSAYFFLLRHTGGVFSRMNEKNHDRAPGQSALTFSLSEELKKRIETAAQSERRSKSNWITLALEEILDRVEATQKPTKRRPAKKP